MRRQATTAFLLLAVLGLARAGRSQDPVPATSGDDDLALVKKAVASAEPVPSPIPSPLPTKQPTKSSSKLRPSEGRWLKVRVVESGEKKSRVTVNLPLAMVNALGDDFPVKLGATHLRLSEVLASLQSGEPLVEVKSEDATVRVWVE